MKAYELLKNSGWCQGSFARKVDGESCTWEDKKAVSFCLFGAICRAYRKDISDLNVEYAEACRKVWALVDSILGFNDTPGTTKEMVLALLEKAGV